MMGMYDHVVCQRELPDGFSGRFQTKDFECQLTTYIITKAGRLTMRVWHQSTVVAVVDVNHHGNLNFYDFDDRVWHEYEAMFVDGNLTGIEVVKADLSELLGRKENLDTT